MGKCIVHCAECGKAIREDDFSQSKAVAIENRTFCSGCREVAPDTQRTRKDSTRMRVPVPVPVARKSTLPLFAGGLTLGFGVVVLIGLSLFRPATGTMTRIGVPPAEQPATPVIRKAVPEIAPTIESRTPPVPAPLDAAPSIRLTSPLDGARFQSPADIVIEAEVGRRNGPVRVEFYHGPIKLGEADAAPYRWVWKGLRYPGNYELMAKLVGAQGESIESQKVWVWVDRGQPAVATRPAGR